MQNNASWVSLKQACRSTLFLARQPKARWCHIPEALPCSNIGEQGRRDETSDGDLGGGGDPDGVDGGVLTSLGRGLPSVEGEHSRLMPLLSSIGG
jgi:hypothetical protein